MRLEDNNIPKHVAIILDGNGRWAERQGKSRSEGHKAGLDRLKSLSEYIINKGKEAFDYAYKNRISYIDFKFKYLKSNKNMKDSTDISKYINEAIKSLNDIDDDILKELKINELSREFGIDESVIKNKIKLSGKKKVKKE